MSYLNDHQLIWDTPRFEQFLFRSRMKARPSMQTPELHPGNTQPLIWPGLQKEESLRKKHIMGTRGDAGCPEATVPTFGVVSRPKN